MADAKDDGYAKMESGTDQTPSLLENDNNYKKADDEKDKDVTLC